MPPRLRPGQTLLLASLVFGLFFGAGNLIFPAGLGRDAGAAVTPATLGFLVTAVGLPVLGIVASAVTGARSVREMTAPVSRRFAVAFTCLLYLTIGPLFAIPRTATVSYEIGVAPLAGDGGLRLLGFTAAFFAVAAVAAFRPGRLMEWVGRYLTPAFLVLLGALVAAAVVAPMSTGALPSPTPAYADGALVRGLLDGYNTMDALASLAFAVVIVDAARRLGVTGPRRMAVELGKAGLLGGAAMAVVIVVMLAVLGALIAFAPHRTDMAVGRGLIAGMVNLARNLGAITGASAMGALFYLASQQVAGTAAAAAVDGMRVTYGVAALLADDTALGTGTRPDAPERRLVRINGAPATAMALAEWLTVLWLTPAMDRLFAEGAGSRRRFLDRLVVALEPGHARQATRLESALRERGRLLAEDAEPDPRWFDAIEAQLAEAGAAVAQARARVVAAVLLGFAQEEKFPEAHFLGDLGQRAFVDERRAPFGKRALVHVGKAAHQRFAQDEIEDGVAEELETLEMPGALPAVFEMETPMGQRRLEQIGLNELTPQRGFEVF
mgnify:CR=1 FL=1